MPKHGFEYRSDDLRSLQSDATDPFGHRDYANTVVAELKSFPSQFTFGLFGDWGSGKSTILNEVGRQLRADETAKTAYVLFDAWRYDGDSLRREFIRTVGEQLRGQGALRKGFDFDSHIESFETETTVSRRRFGFDAIGIRDGAIAALLVAAVVTAMIFLLPKLGLPRPTTLKLLIGFSSAATAFLLFALQRMVTPEPVQATRRRLEFPDQFANNFKQLLGNVSVRRLVIAIDNLDRCSPSRVTEVLSSIKTFLEPAFAEHGERRVRIGEVIDQILLGRKEAPTLSRMCFIVAADDAALRRHLLSQEMSKGKHGELAGPSSSDGARTAVDEYLRKFFGASLRIRNLLDEDIRVFTDEELSQFNQSRGLSRDLSRRLVEMTSHGLKRNPRRIKQFVNNLQMRLQMLAERKERGRIQVDAEVLVAAKLAIIEEEFVEEFEELERDPTLLGTWHTSARGRGDGDGEKSLKPELASFLRFTDDIQPRDIRAYLNLKQTRSELSLPRYAEFVDLLEGGDVTQLLGLLGEDQAEEGKYVEAARTYFFDQRKAEAWSRAHNALRSIIEVPILHGESGEVARQVLEAALQEPKLESRLAQLEPNTLLSVAIGCELDRSKLWRVVTQVIRGLDSTSEARYAAASALTAHVSIVGADARKQIEEILAGDEVRTDFDSYLPFARVMPEVLNHEVTDAALTRLEELGFDAISTTNSAFTVAAESLIAHSDSGRVERLLQIARSGLSGLLEQGSEEFGRVVEELTRVVESAQPVNFMEELAGWLASNRTAIPESARPPARGLAIACVARSREADENAGSAVAEWIFEAGSSEDVLATLGESFARLPPQARARVGDLAAGLLVDDLSSEGTKDRTANLLSLFAVDEQVAIVREAVALAIAREQWAAAESLAAMQSAPVREQIVIDALDRAKESPADHLGDVKFVVSQRSHVDEGKLFELAMEIAQVLFNDRGVVKQLAPELGGFYLADPEHRLDLVEHMIKTEQDMTDPENREAMLRGASRAAGSVRSKARDAIRSRLKEVRTEADMATVAAALLGEA